MKQILLTILCLSAFGFGQGQNGNLSTGAGNEYSNIGIIKWKNGGAIALIDSANPVDTSLPIVMQKGGMKPGTVISFGLDAKSNDSTVSIYFLVDSKYCQEPQTTTGCDSLWTLRGNHGIYGNQVLVDSLTTPSKVNPNFKAFLLPFQITHNLFRLRFCGSVMSGSDTTWVQNTKLMGE